MVGLALDLTGGSSDQFGRQAPHSEHVRYLITLAVYLSVFVFKLNFLLGAIKARARPLVQLAQILDVEIDILAGSC